MQDDLPVELGPEDTYAYVLYVRPSASASPSDVIANSNGGEFRGQVVVVWRAATMTGPVASRAHISWIMPHCDGLTISVSRVLSALCPLSCIQNMNQ